MGPFAWASQKNKLRFVRIYFENPTFDIVRKDKAAKFSIIGAVAWRLSILLEIWSFHQLLFHVNYNSWIQLDISSWYANMCLCMFDISILSHGHGWVYCRRHFWFWFESDGGGGGADGPQSGSLAVWAVLHHKREGDPDPGLGPPPPPPPPPGSCRGTSSTLPLVFRATRLQSLYVSTHTHNVYLTSCSLSTL